MTFAVSWTDQAVNKLAVAWLNSPDKNAVTDAAAAIDRELSKDPDTVGYPTFDTVREFQIPPLGVEFEVDGANNIVHVLSVWLLPT